VIEVVNGVVVGPVMHRVALCFNGREVAVGTVESWEEALIWCQSEWDRRKNDLLYGHYAGNNKSFPGFVQRRE